MSGYSRQAWSLAWQLAQVSRHWLKAVFCYPFRSLPTLGPHCRMGPKTRCLLRR